LQRITDETGIRVTRGRPKPDGDPNERDFLFFNDDNVPEEKLEEALKKLLLIARRKLRDWLPVEGKAAEVAQKLLSDGKLQDDGPSNIGGSGRYNAGGGQNGYGGQGNGGSGSFERPHNTYQASKPLDYDDGPAVEPTQVSLFTFFPFISHTIFHLAAY
jgi:hypothetical protein